MSKQGPMGATREYLPGFRAGNSLPQRVIVSFRDPSGCVVITDGRAFRVVNDDCHETITAFLATPLCAELVNSTTLIDSRVVVDDVLKQQVIQLACSESAEPMVLEHEYIGFPSYPYEWPPEMLYAAGELTLDLMERLLPEKFGLKDASPYNVLYRGFRPVFIDLLSIERRDPCDARWLAYAQFTRTFIYPLLANRYFGLGLDQTFRVYRDGLQPEYVFRMSSIWQKFYPSLLTSVSLPALLSRMDPSRYQKIYHLRPTRSSDQASFILSRQLRGLRRKLEAAKPLSSRKSNWHDYEKREQQRERFLPIKKVFVERALKEAKPRAVLDVGCNLGYFSLLAARAGCFVVAVDRDPVVVGGLWRRAAEEKLDVLPLVVDITWPSGGLGWRNLETRGFLDRAVGTFQCVLMLAVIHHMLVTERIPLEEILKLASELTTDRLLIEFIAPDDKMFRLLTRGNDHLYKYLTRDLFESLSKRYFVIERKQQVGDSSRWLYQMRRADLV